MKLLSIFGTRPEAIKMTPVLAALRREPNLESVVCVTGQHREMLDPVLSLFGIIPDFDLALMEDRQSLNTLAARAIHALERVIEKVGPDRVLVQGDTTSAFAGAIAAFHLGVPLAHVEAGLRTWCNRRPFPEEMYRRSIDVMADLLFAPTASARSNLMQERVPGTILVTGNTAVDALASAVAMLESDEELSAATEDALPRFDAERKLLLVTCHRRERFGESFAGICEALISLARRGDVEIAYPLHLNPQVAGLARDALWGEPHIHLLEPQPFLPFVRLMQKADVILTDSGGIQEEAPSLGKAVLVMRDLSERPEAVEARAARIVGTRGEAIEREVGALIEAVDQPHIPLAGNPYGDGRASGRIVDALLGRPVRQFGHVEESPAEVARFA